MKHHLKKVVAVGVLSLVGVMGVASATTTTKVSGEKASLLFTQIAKSVDITACADKSCDFHLVLKGLKTDEVTWFSNRPSHFMGEMTLEKFVHNWSLGKDSFKVDHPNASFVYFDAQDNITQNIVELMNPKFDKGQNSLSYDVKEVGKVKLLLGTYQHPVLFIDSGCLGKHNQACF